MLEVLIEWLESNMLPCFYSKHLGISCLGCGMQRAFILLLKGDVAGSLAHYPALIPIMFLFTFLPLHLIFKFKHGASVLKYTFIGTATIVVMSFLWKVIIR
jgi:hypothetical protein